MQNILPEKYRGVWQRTSIERPTGLLEDNTSQVYWLQTPHYFTDIRIPKREDPYQSPSLSSILKQRASAGFTQINEKPSNGKFQSILLWNSDLDYHPESGVQDIGGCYYLTLEQAVQEGSRSTELSSHLPETLTFYYQNLPTMIEEGIPPQDYREVWVKRDPGTKQSVLLLSEETPSSSDRLRKGIWLISGDFWSCTLDRYKGLQTIGTRISSSKADSLGDLFKEWKLNKEEQYKSAVEFEAYFGKMENQEGKICFRIYHSTRPDMEGKIFIEISDEEKKKRNTEKKEGEVMVNHWGYLRKWSIITLDHLELVQ